MDRANGGTRHLGLFHENIDIPEVRKVCSWAMQAALQVWLARGLVPNMIMEIQLVSPPAMCLRIYPHV